MLPKKSLYSKCESKMKAKAKSISHDSKEIQLSPYKHICAVDVARQSIKILIVCISFILFYCIVLVVLWSWYLIT